MARDRRRQPHPHRRPRPPDRAINRGLRASGADHPSVPLLLTVPGIGWVLAFTIAAEIGEITRFASPKKLCGYTGLCPRVYQSGDRDSLGPLTKQAPKYLRWAMLESTMHALRHPAYRERYQSNKRRLGRQRGAKVAQIDVARKLTEAIWRMLTNNQPFAPPREAPLLVWPPDGPFGLAPPEPASNAAVSCRRAGHREMSAARPPQQRRGTPTRHHHHR
jgi:Transposase IS116/IS110/IS902 family